MHMEPDAALHHALRRLDGGANEEEAPAPREVWLVVDGSGSMSGGPEVQTRDAASFFVKDLPQGADRRLHKKCRPCRGT